MTVVLKGLDVGGSHPMHLPIQLTDSLIPDSVVLTYLLAYTERTQSVYMCVYKCV